MNFKKLYNKFFFKPNLENASKEFSLEILKEYNKNRPLGPQPTICYAPFKNIYFGHYGKATACCYNRDFEIGTYPKQTIKEIWFSKEANLLRTFLENNQLDYGCELCKKHILSKNFDANKSQQYDEAILNENKYPSVMEFELSNVCNLECVMCHGDFSSSIRKNREKLPPIPQAYDSNFVHQLEEFIPHLEEVKCYGGEPFLIEIYYEIWKKIIEIKPSIRISVQTNATILNKRVRDILQKANFHINISIDSLIKKDYEEIRINSKYDRVMKNIDWFQNYCKEKNTFFGISACLMNTNYSEMESFVSFCNKKNAQLYFHFLVTPNSLSLKNLPKDELLEIYRSLAQVSLPYSSELEIKNKTHFDDTLNQIKFLVDVKNEKVKTFEDFKDELSSYVEDISYLSLLEKRDTITRTFSKLDKLKDSIKDEKDFYAVFQGSFGGKKALETIENKSLEELIEIVNEMSKK